MYIFSAKDPKAIVSPSPTILSRNLAALSQRDPALSKRIAGVVAGELVWGESKAGPLCATRNHLGRQLSLASRFDPVAQAGKLIAQVDPAKHAGVFAVGLGLGHHIKLLADQLDDSAVLIVFEPDLSLCKAVFEHIDHSAWLKRKNVILADDTIDMGSLVGRLEGYAGYMTQGTMIVTHPVVRQTHHDEVIRFGQLITDVMGYCRTNVATALVNAARTVKNLTANLGHYAAGATINELKDIAKGMPAVCVSAGPSLAKNIDLLRDKAWRKKIVLISVQTALKPLLDRGIEPDFVTALDYHAISRRFYEGIGDLPNVTLVAEPKVHASVVDGFPGPVRMTGNGFLERCLAPASPKVTPISGGATVAHLSVYLAQHLGCDPIILIGQDLGFSNGLYYCPGSAIHEVWANELGRFNTVEMMEWQRIVRHRNHLSAKPDIDGKKIYSDEQMLTYLKQFERDFFAAPQTIINATQGGMVIKNTKQLTLLEALEQNATQDIEPLPLPALTLSQEKLGKARKIMRQRIDEITRIRSICQQTIPLLGRIIANQRDERIVQRLFGELEDQQKLIHSMDVSFGLINELNTIGAFKRNKADRAINHQETSDQFERQKAQLGRDIENLEWMIQACDEALNVFGEGLDRIHGLLAEAEKHNT